jgi:hypothetical protein
MIARLLGDASHNIRHVHFLAVRLGLSLSLNPKVAS